MEILPPHLLVSNFATPPPSFQFCHPTSAQMWPPHLLVSGLVTLKEGVSRVHRHHSSNFHTSSLSEQNRTQENTKQHNTFYTSFLTTMTLPTLHKAHFSSFPLGPICWKSVFISSILTTQQKLSTFVFLHNLYTIFSGNLKYHL